ETRKMIFKVHTKNMPLASDVLIDNLANKTEGYVGADIEGVCREAAIMALRKDINATEVFMAHFEEAINKVNPSGSKDIEKGRQRHYPANDEVVLFARRNGQCLPYSILLWSKAKTRDFYLASGFKWQETL
ncbi:MAG: hypothetical protein AAB328_10545, partial [candidate division NC10 bacterium]